MMFSKMSVSNCLLPVYRNTVDFQLFTLCPETLLNSFITWSFFVDSMGLSA